MTGEEYVNNFYNLFQVNDEYFIGSREQARILMMMKINRFIPKKYIEATFKNFVSAGLIINTKKTADNRYSKIGEKKFPKGVKPVYQKVKLSPKEIEYKLKSAAVFHENCLENTAEMTTIEDIKKIRMLEKEKNIIVSHINHNVCKNMNLRAEDSCFLYNMPRDQVLSIISQLDEYDPKLEAKKAKYKEVMMQEKQKEREFLNEKYSNAVFDMFERLKNIQDKLSFEIGFITITDDLKFYPGKLKPQEIILDKENNNIIFKSDSFNISIPVLFIEIDFNNLKINIYGKENINLYKHSIGIDESFCIRLSCFNEEYISEFTDTIFTVWQLQEIYKDK